CLCVLFSFFFQAEDGIRDRNVTGVQTCALPISLVFTHVDDAARLFRDNAQSGLRLRIDDMHKAPERAAALGQQLSTYGVVRDWTQNNRTWFAAVQTEKRMLFLILLLIVTVAAFNLLSSLVMTVKDKQSDIAILRSLGATPRSIAWIFLLQ